jgi:hypothetical protein
MASGGMAMGRRTPWLPDRYRQAVNNLKAIARAWLLT